MDKFQARRPATLSIRANKRFLIHVGWLTAPQRALREKCQAEKDVFGISKDRFKDVEPFSILDAKQN